MENKQEVKPQLSEVKRKQCLLFRQRPSPATSPPRAPGSPGHPGSPAPKPRAAATRRTWSHGDALRTRSFAETHWSTWDLLPLLPQGFCPSPAPGSATTPRHRSLLPAPHAATAAPREMLLQPRRGRAVQRAPGTKSAELPGNLG